MWDDYLTATDTPSLKVVPDLPTLQDVTDDIGDFEEEEKVQLEPVQLSPGQVTSLVDDLQKIVGDHQETDFLRAAAQRVINQAELNEIGGLPEPKAAAVVQVAAESLEDPESQQRAADFAVRIVDEAMRVVNPSTMGDPALDPEADPGTVDSMRRVIGEFLDSVHEADAADTQEQADIIVLDAWQASEAAVDKMDPGELVEYLKAMREVGKQSDVSVAPLVAAFRQTMNDPLIALGMEDAKRKDDEKEGSSPGDFKTVEDVMRIRRRAKRTVAARLGGLVQAAEEEGLLRNIKHDSMEAAEEFTRRTEAYEWEEKLEPGSGLRNFLGSKIRLSAETRGYLSVAARTGHLEALMREIDFGSDAGSIALRTKSVEKLRSLAIRTQLDAMRSIPKEYKDALGRISATLEQVRSEDLVREALEEELLKDEEDRLPPSLLMAKLAALGPDRSKAPQQRLPRRNYSLFFADFARGLVNSTAMISEHVPVVLKQASDALDDFTAKQSRIRVASRQRYDSAYTALLELIHYMSGAATNLSAVIRDMGAILDQLPSNQDMEKLAEAAAKPLSKRTDEDARRIRLAAKMARMQYLPLIQLYYGGFKRVYKAFNVASCTFVGILVSEGLPEVRNSALWYNVKQNCPEFDLDDTPEEKGGLVEDLVRRAIARGRKSGRNLMNALRYTEAYMVSSGLIADKEAGYFKRMTLWAVRTAARLAAGTVQGIARAIAGSGKFVYNLAVHLKESWVGRAGFGIHTIGESMGVVLRILVFCTYSWATGQYSVPTDSTLAMRIASILATPLFGVCMGYASIDGLFAVFRYTSRAISNTVGSWAGKFADFQPNKPIFGLLLGATGHAACMRIWRMFCASLGALTMDLKGPVRDVIDQVWVVPASIIQVATTFSTAGSGWDLVTTLSMLLAASGWNPADSLLGMREWTDKQQTYIRFFLSFSSIRLAILLVQWLLGGGILWGLTTMFTGASAQYLLTGNTPDIVLKGASAVRSVSGFLWRNIYAGSPDTARTVAAVREATLMLSKGATNTVVQAYLDEAGVDVRLDVQNRRFVGKSLDDAKSGSITNYLSSVYNRMTGAPGLGDIVDDVEINTNDIDPDSPYAKLLSYRAAELSEKKEYTRELFERARELLDEDNVSEEERKATLEAMAEAPFFAQQMMTPGASVMEELSNMAEGIRTLSFEARVKDALGLMERLPSAWKLAPVLMGMATGSDITQFDFTPAEWEQLCADTAVATETILPLVEMTFRGLVKIDNYAGVTPFVRDKMMRLVKTLSPKYYAQWEAQRARGSKALVDLIEEDQVGFSEFQRQANARMEVLAAQCRKTNQQINDILEVQQARALMIDRSRKVGGAAKDIADDLKQRVEKTFSKSGRIWQRAEDFQIELSARTRNARMMAKLDYKLPEQRAPVVRSIATQLMLATNSVRTNEVRDVLELDMVVERQTKQEAQDRAVENLVLTTGLRRRRRRR